MSEPNPSCRDCRYGVDLDSAWDHSMQCRRYPPKPGGAEHPRGGLKAVWPIVLRNDWCGEFSSPDPNGEPE
jgi:hypothetical protein